MKTASLIDDMVQNTGKFCWSMKLKYIWEMQLPNLSFCHIAKDFLTDKKFSVRELFMEMF